MPISDDVLELRMHAAHGDSDSQFALARRFATGRGVDRDYREAHNWFKRAALNGHREAQVELALLYQSGHGVPRDMAQARYWMSLAAEAGNHAAKRLLGGFDGTLGPTPPARPPDRTADSGLRTAGSTPAAPLSASAAPVPPEAIDIDRLMRPFDRLVGLGPVKTEIRSLISLAKVARQRQAEGLPVAAMSWHMVFTGNPGTGKTTVARLLGETFKALGFLKSGHVIEVDRADLVAKVVGGTAKQVDEQVKRALDGVLLIDEAYALTRSDNQQDYGFEAVETLLKLMEDHRDRLIVIAAGYSDEMRRFLNSNPGLKSRFGKIVVFPDFDAAELMAIFETMVSDNHYELGDAAQKRATAVFAEMHRNRDRNFGNGRAVRNMFEDVVTRQAIRVAALASPGRAALCAIEAEDLPDVLGLLPNSQDIKTLLAPLHELIGLEDVKDEIDRLVHLMRVQMERRKKDMPAPPLSWHMVFTGNPGTGKTTVARLLGDIYRQLGVLRGGQVVEIDRSGLVAAYVGQTAIKVADVVEQAKDGILFIDEAYALVRGEGNDFGREAIDTLLKAMEDLRDRMVVIAAGYPREMAVFVNANPGLKSRFSRTIHFPDYDGPALAAIFDLFCTKGHYELDETARTRVQAYLDHAYATRGPDFGNGRLVRHLFETALSRHARRLATDPDLDETELVRLEGPDIPDPGTGL